MLIWFSHANIETTLNTYTHATEKMAEQSVEIFEKVTKENLPTKKNKPIPNKRHGLSLLKN